MLTPPKVRGISGNVGLEGRSSSRHIYMELLHPKSVAHTCIKSDEPLVPNWSKRATVTQRGACPWCFEIITLGRFIPLLQGDEFLRIWL